MCIKALRSANAGGHALALLDTVRAPCVQAQQAQRACSSLLQAALSPANCFSLLALGHAQRLRGLERRARSVAETAFVQAMALDRAGFIALPEQVPPILALL